MARRKQLETDAAPSPFAEYDPRALMARMLICPQCSTRRDWATNVVNGKGDGNAYCPTCNERTGLGES